MDYEEGQILSNPDTGQAVQLKDGAWVKMDSPMTWSGAGKALASGVLHQGVPGVLGAAGDLSGLINKGTAWLTNKVQGTEGTPDETTPEQVSASTSAIPIIGAINKYAPTSESIKQKMEPYAGPEYEPQNFAERTLKTTGSLLPSIALGPAGAEEAGASLMAKALGKASNTAANAGRYAMAPALLSEGVKSGFDAVGAGDSPYKEPAAMVALLASPMAATKLITPNPANAIQRAAGRTLDQAGATYTPKQLNQGNLESEAQSLGFFGGNNAIKNVNTQNVENFNRGTLRSAYGDTLPPGPIQDQAMGATKLTPELRQGVTQSIDDEFNRLAAAHSMPLDTGLEKRLDGVIKKYQNDASLRKDPQPVQDLQDIKDIFSNGKPSGFIDGRQYLNLRSRLSNFAADATDPSVGRTLRQMRDALDDQMEHVVSTYHPQDTGAFQRARNAYQNDMIVNRAMGSTGRDAANYNISPDALADSARAVLGPEAFSSEAHPLARLARAGQQTLEPLPGYSPTGLTHNFQLAATLGGGSALGGLGQKLLEGGAGAHDTSALGYLLGAGVPAAMYAGRPVTGALMQNPWGRAYLGNQVLPTEARRALTRDPASAAMLAEALANRKRQPAQQEP